MTKTNMITPRPWNQNGFNMGEVIKIKDGPDADGHRYVDGRHQVSVAIFKRIEDAKFACVAVNERSELIAALQDTLNMLRAAHMQCGVHHDGNPRVIKARDVLARTKSDGAQR